jgi:DNA-binding NtrC family response regulator
VLAFVEPKRALDGARILVVEDDYIISSEIKAILAAAGAEVMGPCRTLAQASRLIGADAISGAVLDFRLGHGTSLPVARQLKEHGIPFLFFTGQLSTSQIDAEYPGTKVISKPFQRGAILAAVVDMLEADKKVLDSGGPAYEPSAG